MQLKELLSLPVFSDFQLIAGNTGLNREVRNVDILEYEWFKQNFSVFSEADFVLTSLFFAKDEPELIYQSFLKLLERKISAIAIKTVFFQELPPEVIKLADENAIPLFTFTSAYMEDLIIGFNELQKTQQRHLLYEEKQIFERSEKIESFERRNYRMLRVALITAGMLVCSNLFMTFAWYGHLKFLGSKPWFVAAVASWGIALFEYMIQVPANRYGYTALNVVQLKVIQEVVALTVFAPFAVFMMNQPLKLDYLWSALCLVGAVYFAFR